MKKYPDTKKTDGMACFLAFLLIGALAGNVFPQELLPGKWQNITYRGKPVFAQEDGGVVIEGASAEDSGSWYQIFPVTAKGWGFGFSCEVETRGLEGHGVRWYVTFKDAGQKVVKESLGVPCKQKDGKQKLSLRVKTPEGAATMVVRINLDRSKGRIKASQFQIREAREDEDAVMVEGRVLCDDNQNRTIDESDPGIPNAVVSDGVELAVTDQKGNFQFKHSVSVGGTGQSFQVFVSVPSGFEPVHRKSWFQSVSVVPDTPARAQLLLKRVTRNCENFSWAHISDTHLQPEEPAVSGATSFIYRYARGSRTWDAFFGTIIPRVLKDAPAFVVDTGDIGLKECSADPAADTRKYGDRLQQIDATIYTVQGNHDGMEILELCPPYYSFNYGRFHFVCLNRFFDGFPDRSFKTMFEWVKKDLRACPKDTPVIVMEHMHFGADRHPNLEAFMDAVAGANLKAVFFGHTHGIMVCPLPNGIPQICTPSANYGGGWCNSYDGYPPTYRVVRIEGDRIVESAARTLEGDNPLTFVTPQHRMVLDGMMFPYMNASKDWDGILRVNYFDFGYDKIASMEWSLDGGEMQPMKKGRVASFCQGSWTSQKDIRQGMAKGRHVLKVQARKENGESRTAEIEVFTDADLLAGRNILPNPSFEEAGQDGRSPAGWAAPDGKQVEWVDGVGHAGKRSLRMSLEPYKWVELLPGGIEVDCSKRYHLTVWVKGENVTDCSYAIFSGFSDAHITRLPAGTYDWRPVNVQFRIKPGITRISLFMANWKAGAQAASIWVDDLSLKAVEN
ncbi:MAG: metallophosphoesterase [Verrucomicrobiae bacterium]|nr:metallophosphoesterase [Verrucomicrobiae bacterium]